jgi:DNA-binding transcriptional MerR regulator/predicted transcriptional regulator YdeE
MFTIGDLARHGRVSVRMLRHYDALGLLQPAHVDPSTGHRHYEAHQLSRLNRVIALKDLGFTLQQVGEVLDDKVDVEELRGMLRLRRAELAERIASDTARLSRVEARLHMIESEGLVPTDDVVLKSVPAVRVAELTATAASFEPQDISPVIQPLYPDLCARLKRAGVQIADPSIAYYEQNADGIVVHAAMPVNVESSPEHDFEVVDLPAQDTATIVHRGCMSEIGNTWQSLARWIDANGYRSAGLARELYLYCEGQDDSTWVTELQEPITTV